MVTKFLVTTSPEFLPLTKLAWSIVLATKGLEGFVDALLNNEEYLSNFGDNVGALPAAAGAAPAGPGRSCPLSDCPATTRNHLRTLESLGYDFSADRSLPSDDFLETPPAVRKVAGAITAGLAICLMLVMVACSSIVVLGGFRFNSHPVFSVLSRP